MRDGVVPGVEVDDPAGGQEQVRERRSRGTDRAGIVGGCEDGRACQRRKRARERSRRADDDVVDLIPATRDRSTEREGRQGPRPGGRPRALADRAIERLAVQFLGAGEGGQGPGGRERDVRRAGRGEREAVGARRDECRRQGEVPGDVYCSRGIIDLQGQRATGGQGLGDRERQIEGRPRRADAEVRRGGDAGNCCAARVGVGVLLQRLNGPEDDRRDVGLDLLAGGDIEVRA